MKSILIMAAGSGSRYGALKQFDELGPNGEFLFEYGIYDALACGFQHVVLITRKAYVTELSAYLSDRLPKGVKLDVLAQEVSDLPAGARHSFSREKPWGTAHAVWTARGVIDGPFVVVNADDYYGRRSYELAGEFIDKDESMSEFGLVPYRLSETLSAQGSVSRAVCRQVGGYLEDIVEYLELVEDDNGIVDLQTHARFSGEELVSMNFWILGHRVFELIEEDLVSFVGSPEAGAGGEIYIPKQVQQWRAAGKVRVKLTGSCADWFGVTYAKDKSRAMEKLVEKANIKFYPSPLWKRPEQS